jgi:hypothetical protein
LENVGEDELNQSDDDASFVEEEDEDDCGVGRGEIVEIPVEFCQLPNIQGGGLWHFAHEICLKELEKDDIPCAFCKCSDKPRA